MSGRRGRKRSRGAASELGVEEGGSGGEVGGHEVEVEEHEEGVEGEDLEEDRKSTRLNSSHSAKSRMPSSA